MPYRWKIPTVFIPESTPGWNAWLICAILIWKACSFSMYAPNCMNGMISTTWTRANIHCTDCTTSRFWRNNIVRIMLRKVVRPITGNIPETIPSVTEKASFSGDNPSLGTSRKGMRILCLMDSKIFKATNYRIILSRKSSQ